MNRARELWEGLGRNSQIILVVSSLGVLIALVGFIAWASTPEYVPLFSNLAAPDANAISDKLREANVPFRLQQQGSAIEVPAQQRDEMRMKIMSLGLPAESSATLDYDILKTGSSPMDTGVVETNKLLRTRESQISRAIMSFQQIASASVRIAPADDSPFASTKHPSKASVLVQLKSGQSLSDENIHSIVRLTQMSYTGLDDKNITVADGQGDLLFDGTRVGDGTMADDRIKEQKQLAQAKRTELQAALDRAIGPRKSVVLVNYELNSDKQEIKQDTTEQGPVTQSTTQTEKLNGIGSKGGGGAPGTAPNVTPGATPNPSLAGGGAPGTPGYASVNSAEGSYISETTSKTSEPSRTVTHTIKGEGRIEKLTVSALIDENAKIAPDKVASIEQMLKTAIGATAADTSRQVTVAQVPFDHSEEDKEAKEAASARSSENMSRLVATAVPLGIMLLTFLLLARALKKPAGRAMANGQLMLAGAGAGGMSYDMSGMNLALNADGTPVPGQTVGSALTESSSPLGLSAASGPKTYEVIEEAFDAHMESILHLTRSKPEMVALLVRSWIAKDD